MSATPTFLPPRTRNGLRPRIEVVSQKFLQPGVLIRVVLYAAIAVYARTILFDYVYDDNSLIILNPLMESWKSVPGFFTHSFWSFLGGVQRPNDYYRPLVMLAFASIRHLLGPAPGWFHLIAAGIHIVAIYLTYRLACETTGNKTLAAIAAGIFGLHPTKVETAAWISGLSDSLSAVFFLGSIIGYLKWRRAVTDRGRTLALSLLLLVLAFLSKESAILAPVLIGIYEFTATQGRFRERLRATMLSVWPFATVAGVAVIIRTLVVPMPSGHFLNGAPGFSTLYTAPQAILWYVVQQLWPINLSVQYPVVVVTSASLTHFVLPLCAVLILLSCVFWAVRRSPVGIFFLSWYLLMLAPVVVYFFALQAHDRYFYLPSIATSIGAAYLIVSLGRFSAIAEATTVIVLFAILSVLTVSYSYYWDNDLRLFNRVVQIAPDNPNAWQFLAEAYATNGRKEEAERIGWNLVKTSRRPAIGWCILGSLRLRDTDYEGTREALQNAFNVEHGRDLVCTVELGEVDLTLNRNEEAADIFRRVLKSYPRAAYVHGKLAVALKQLGRPEEAAREQEIQKRLQ